jgi:UDP-N-acetylglucosamine:LPS N-acetylglucosamine transferase
VRFERALAGRRALEWIRTSEPDVIVSTYSFATLVIGRLREENRIDVPTVAYLTDFGVHPRTVHPAIDLHLAVHPIAAQDTRRYVPGRVEAPGPAVSPAFQSRLVPRQEARDRLGFAADERIVLVVCGSWGIGANLPAVVDTLTSDGRFRVVTACGKDQKLKARLEAAGSGTVLGWTNALPLYMAAADVVVENAGGLSSLEAFASGVPVVSFDPIPGHGRDNVRTMVRAGVTTAPKDHRELCAAVGRLAANSPERRHQLGEAAAMFHWDPIESILDLIAARR